MLQTLKNIRLLFFIYDKYIRVYLFIYMNASTFFLAVNVRCKNQILALLCPRLTYAHYHPYTNDALTC